MPKEITSKKTKKVQFVTDAVWHEIEAMGKAKLYFVKDIPEKKLPKPEEIIKKTKDGSNG